MHDLAKRHVGGPAEGSVVRCSNDALDLDLTDRFNETLSAAEERRVPPAYIDAIDELAEAERKSAEYARKYERTCLKRNARMHLAIARAVSRAGEQNNTKRNC